MSMCLSLIFQFILDLGGEEDILAIDLLSPQHY